MATFGSFNQMRSTPYDQRYYQTVSHHTPLPQYGVSSASFMQPIDRQYQSYAGPLSMPPFLFNHISQPWSSLPLPPPLPQAASFYFENYVRQMFLQHNANPTWQSPQPIILQFPNSSSPRIFCVCTPQPPNSRITPLPNRSTSALPTARNQSRQRYQNSYRNEVTSLASWSSNIPPLPPGAILILDEYLSKKKSSQRHRYSKTSPKSPSNATKPTRRSITINTNNTNWIQPKKFPSVSETSENESEVHSRRSLGNSKSAASSHSPYSSSITASIKPAKSETVDQKPPPSEASNVNITNITATDDTISPSNSDVLRDLRLSLAMREVSGENEEKIDQRTTTSSRATSSFHSQSKTTKTNSMAERDTVRRSSRTTFASTSDMMLDSVSQIGTTRTNRQSERNISSTDTF